MFNNNFNNQNGNNGKKKIGFYGIFFLVNIAIILFITIYIFSKARGMQ